MYAFYLQMVYFRSKPKADKPHFINKKKNIKGTASDSKILIKNTSISSQYIKQKYIEGP